MDREERKYPQMPEREEHQYLRMLGKVLGRTGRRLIRGWTEGTGDE